MYDRTVAAESGRGKRAGWNATSVRALRNHLGLTQRELAAELGARQQTVSEWETGQYVPRGSSARLLSLIAERAEFGYTIETDRE